MFKCPENGIPGPLYKKSKIKLFGKLGLDNSEYLKKIFRKNHKKLCKKRLNDRIILFIQKKNFALMEKIFQAWIINVFINRIDEDNFSDVD